MATTLSEAFFLRQGRRNFEIQFRTNEEDRKAYFGTSKLNLELTRSIRERYAMGLPPKKYLYGEYGAGKTHTLFNLKYQLEQNSSDLPFKIKCLLIEGEFKKKTTYAYLHGQMMEGISMDDVRTVVQEYLATHATGDLGRKLRETFGDANIAKAIQGLGLGGQQISLWKWLCGHALSTSELNAHNLTKNMDTVGQMVKVLTGLCRIFRDKGVYYLFLLDELEGLNNVDDSDAQESFHDAFRKLADQENDVVGFIVSIFAGSEEQIPQFVFRPDIVSRIGGAHVHHLNYFQQDQDVEQFILDLFALVIDAQKRGDAEKAGSIPSGLKFYPFTDDAKDQFVHYAVSAPGASLPRNIIDAVNECALCAFRRKSSVIDVQDLEPANKIFQERH
jgi:hypothetical protein